MAERVKKENGSKTRYDLIPVPALKGVCDVYAKGSEKDGRVDFDWVKGTEWSLYMGALLRHWFAFMEGRDFDQEDGLPHIDKVIANAMILSTYQKKRLGMDDRPKYDKLIDIGGK